MLPSRVAATLRTSFAQTEHHILGEIKGALGSTVLARLLLLLFPCRRFGNEPIGPALGTRDDVGKTAGKGPGTTIGG